MYQETKMNQNARYESEKYKIVHIYRFQDLSDPLHKKHFLDQKGRYFVPNFQAIYFLIGNITSCIAFNCQKLPKSWTNFQPRQRQFN